jgi:hypothetical protein
MRQRTVFGDNAALDNLNGLSQVESLGLYVSRNALLRELPEFARV